MQSLIYCTPNREMPNIYGKDNALTTYEGLRNILLDTECFINALPTQVHTKEQVKALNSLGKQIFPMISQLMELSRNNSQTVFPRK